MRPDFIETFTGRRFQPLNPDPTEIDIRDIAHALSLIVRYGGQCREFYCVGQHSVAVSETLEDWGCSKEIQMWGLIHDASEGLGLNDIVAPVKSADCMAGYREAETRLMVAVCRRFGLPIAEPERVRTADLVLRATEVRDLMPNRPGHWADLTAKPLPRAIEPWAPSVAERAFLSRFEELAA